ncbi:MAG: FKBP-type peptidyl-prolyl cis-trans isomerase [Bradymonadales bacterium]
MKKKAIFLSLIAVSLMVFALSCKRAPEPAMEAEVPKTEQAHAAAQQAAQGDEHSADDGHDHDAHADGHDHGAHAALPAPADVAEAPEDAQRTPSGLAYKILKQGAEGGPKPTAADTVKVHYSGWTTDGKMFDSSVVRGEPATFGLTQVIAGWTEGLQLMKVGDSARFWIPEDLAYKGRAGAPAGTLVFDVDLLQVVKAPEKPADLTPPQDAIVLESGVAYKITRENPQGASIGEKHLVSFDFAVWTSDGEMVDASIKHGKPMFGPVEAFFQPWKEVLPHVKVGEKVLIWAPEALAFGGAEGAPAGDITFELDVLRIAQMPETPEDIDAAPETATKESNGVAWRIIKEGAGNKPTLESKVVFHYTGWTADGNVFDSSLWHEKPYSGQVGQLISVWAQSLTQMTVGEQRRIWVPEGEASKGEAKLPPGKIVFDLELLEIK